MQFNNSQQRAIAHNTGPMLVLAGPGSGKTAVITQRIKTLIEHRKVPPERILVITFSKTAAIGMKNRFEELTFHNYLTVRFGTFHSLFFRILKEYYRYDNSSIITDEDKFRVLKDYIRKYKINSENERELLLKLSSDISNYKSRIWTNQSGFRPGSCSLDQFKSIYKEYVLFLNSEGKLDFDDMLTKCADLFEEAPEVLAKVREEYDHILIDEFQDINEIQYELIGKIAWPKNNIFVVGDDDQSIYGFRGSSPSLMHRFVKDYKKAEQILLNVNYRCRKKILDPALRLVGHNKNRFKKALTCYKDEGGKFEYLVFGTLEEVNLFIVKYLEQLRKAGGELSEVAVLYRMNHQARTLYKELTLHNIPCKSTEKMPCVFDHWIAGDMIAYLKLAQGSCDRSDLMKIINRPKRYVNREDIRKVLFKLERDSSVTGRRGQRLGDSEEILRQLINVTGDRSYVADELVRLKNHLEFLKKLDVLSSIKFIRHAMGYNGFLREYADTKGVSEDELFDVMYELEESAVGCARPEDWLSVMEDYRKRQKGADNNIGTNVYSNKGHNSGNHAEQKHGVNLMTYHTSKGLEFETVFILDMLEGYTPAKQTETIETLEEERRALYVAMTRAKENLFLLSSGERMGRATVESRFIKEIFEGQQSKEKNAL